MKAVQQHILILKHLLTLGGRVYWIACLGLLCFAVGMAGVFSEHSELRAFLLAGTVFLTGLPVFFLSSNLCELLGKKTLALLPNIHSTSIRACWLLTTVNALLFLISISLNHTEPPANLLTSFAIAYSCGSLGYMAILRGHSQGLLLPIGSAYVCQQWLLPLLNAWVALGMLCLCTGYWVYLLHCAANQKAPHLPLKVSGPLLLPFSKQQLPSRYLNQLLPQTPETHCSAVESLLLGSPSSTQGRLLQSLLVMMGAGVLLTAILLFIQFRNDSTVSLAVAIDSSLLVLFLSCAVVFCSTAHHSSTERSRTLWLRIGGTRLALWPHLEKLFWQQFAMHVVLAGVLIVVALILSELSLFTLLMMLLNALWLEVTIYYSNTWGKVSGIAWPLRIAFLIPLVILLAYTAQTFNRTALASIATVIFIAVPWFLRQRSKRAFATVDWQTVKLPAVPLHHV